MLQAAIVGAGRWGQRLIESVQGKSGQIRFAAAVTRHPDALAPLAARFGLRLTTSYAEVLADPSIGAVVLATPHSQHAAEIAAAAGAGKHLFVEKPFTLTRTDAEAAVAACRAAGITLSVGFNRRFAPAYAEMARRIAAGTIGTLRHIEGNFSGPATYQIAPDNWRSNRVESPGGSMTARGCHVLDAMVNIAGPVRDLFATSERLQLTIDVDDTTSCLLRFAGGATGTLATLHAATQTWRLQAFGAHGALEIRGDNELMAFDLDGVVERTVCETVDKERAELEAFAKAVAQGVKFAIAPEDIVNVVAATEAVVVSARSGRAVTVE